MRLLKLCATMVGLMSLLAACASDPGDDLETDVGHTEQGVYYDQIASGTVLPSATGAGIGAGGPLSPNAAHYFYRPVIPAGPPQLMVIRLMVFLHGHGGQPAGYEKFMRTAAHHGFHVIGLDYPAPSAVGDICDQNDACYEQYRHEVYSGGNYYSGITVPPQDAIYARLMAVLSWLRQNHPNEGWDNFTTSNGILIQPRWNVITIAGHSLGAGYAAYIGTRAPVARVVMFSGVVDALDTSPPLVSTPVSWVTGPSLTPASKFFGLVHTNDLGDPGTPIARNLKIRSDWAGIGMAGPELDVDSLTDVASFGSAQRLITDRTAGIPNPSAAHNFVVSDNGPVDANGLPVYRFAWLHMLGVD
jgi:hypothetical protein